MAKVTLLGSLASSVGGVVPTSRVGAAASSVSLQANARVIAKAEFEVSAKAEVPKTKSKRTRAGTASTNESRIKTTEGKAMKNSINVKRNWWAASLLVGPVDGSSN
jgi:hypothetical protein